MSESPWTDEPQYGADVTVGIVCPYCDGEGMVDAAALDARVAELQRAAKVEARREAARESVDERRALSLGTLRVAADELRQAGHAASADILEQSVREMETN